MRELTFTGYLTKYVRALSSYDTGSLYKLAAEAAKDNPRLREPLLLYALFSDNADVLLRASKDKNLHSAYHDMLSQYSKEDMYTALQQEDSKLPVEYQKVWASYLSLKNRHQGENETKALMRNRVLKLQQATKITNYRIYKELGLNPGNVNAWLKHGASEKVSLGTARKVLHYIEAASS